MKRQPAKVLDPAELRRVLKHVQHTRHPTRNRTMVLLSFKAGLRACEIAGLTWPMVLTGTGRLGRVLTISDGIAKHGRLRRVPMNAQLAEALKAFARRMGPPDVRPSNRVRAWAAHDSAERRQLVQHHLPGGWFDRLLLTFRAADLHHQIGTDARQDGRFIARHTGVGRTSGHHHHRALHRGESRRATETGRTRLSQATIPPQHSTPSQLNKEQRYDR